MKKNKIFLIGLLVGLVVVFSFINKSSAQEGMQDIPFATSKTDRTLIKDVIVNQEKILKALEEIKSEISSIKEK
ncbi:hypothetical protein MNBD_BACTEROID05-1055 [hydrothermal vent metagenome]|uniref:Uncharacterized protein n=1 Tax=hydrothermal vent metagenome TaxID=652676 RepID=A0A3B0TL76_9ZZZZ